MESDGAAGDGRKDAGHGTQKQKQQQQSTYADLEEGRFLVCIADAFTGPVRQ
jgi:hypothetical protein